MCFCYVVHVVIPNGSTSLSMLMCTSFYFECCHFVNKMLFFFLLLSRYCSNKISSNETSICFLWHFIGAEDLKRWCNQMIPVWVAFGLIVWLIKSKISYQIQSTNSRSNCFYIICVNCDKNTNLSTSMWIHDFETTHTDCTPSLLNLTVVHNNINIKINFIFFTVGLLH